MAAFPFDTLALQPYPSLTNSLAWNAADAQLVELAALERVACENTLLVNDEFGALCVATKAASLWTDSWLSQHASQKNRERNHIAPVHVIWSDNDKELSALDTELVLLRVPKQLAYFEYQLSILSSSLSPGVPVIAAGMDKHLFNNTAALLEKYLGPVERYLGKRKARTFRAVRDDNPPRLFNSSSEFYSETIKGSLLSLANGFSRQKTDIGSQFLIENFSLLSPVHNTIDLACGNGVLGLSALRTGITEQLVCCDESAMALAAAQVNAQRHFPEVCVSFHHGDGLFDYRGAYAELILCNPPFHHNHRVDAGVGRRLLTQSAHKLKKGGRLCIVANRHLDYLPALKREFSKVEKLAQNSKFILWLAHR